MKMITKSHLFHQCNKPLLVETISSGKCNSQAHNHFGCGPRCAAAKQKYPRCAGFQFRIPVARVGQKSERGQNSNYPTFKFGPTTPPFSRGSMEQLPTVSRARLESGRKGRAVLTPSGSKCVLNILQRDNQTKTNQEQSKAGSLQTYFVVHLQFHLLGQLLV